MESAIQVVSFGKTDFSASKREISKNLYMKIEWKSAKIPKSCNLESNHVSVASLLLHIDYHLTLLSFYILILLFLSFL